MKNWAMLGECRQAGRMQETGLYRAAERLSEPDGVICNPSIIMLNMHSHKNRFHHPGHLVYKEVGLSSRFRTCR